MFLYLVDELIYCLHQLALVYILEVRHDTGRKELFLALH